MEITSNNGNYRIIHQASDVFEMDYTPVVCYESYRDADRLCVGDLHSLNRDQTIELISHLQRWVDTGFLKE